MTEAEPRYYVLRNNKELGLFAGDLVELVGPKADVRIITKNAMRRSDRRFFLHLGNEAITETGLIPVQWIEEALSQRPRT